MEKFLLETEFLRVALVVLEPDLHTRLTSEISLLLSALNARIERCVPPPSGLKTHFFPFSKTGKYGASPASILTLTLTNCLEDPLPEEHLTHRKAEALGGGVQLRYSLSGSPSESFPPGSWQAEQNTYTFLPRQARHGYRTGFRPRDSCLQTLDSKKKKSANLMVLNRGQQRLAQGEKTHTQGRTQPAINC